MCALSAERPSRSRIGSCRTGPLLRSWSSYGAGFRTVSNEHHGRAMYYEISAFPDLKDTAMTADIELRQTPGKGEGMFACRPFAIGETVLRGQLGGRTIANHSHASQLGAQEFGFHTGLTSKFNHSCNPNCGIRVNETGAHDFVAMQSIMHDQETTFDYAMRNFRIAHFPGSCNCNEADCRGAITGWRDLRQERKDDYARFVAPYLVEMDRLAAGAGFSAFR